MIPINDQNPTRRLPVVTIAIMIICAGVYFFVQPDPLSMGTPQRTEFDFERAAIPCEIVSGRPLTADEIEATLRFGQTSACGLGSAASPPVFGNKDVLLAVLVSMFLHGSLLHLGGNLLFFWVFGNNIEDHLGPVRFVVFYLLGGVIATLAHVLSDVDSTVPLIGASGAIAGVMGAYLVWFPAAPVRTAVFVILVIFVRVPAALLLGVWFVSQFYIDPSDGVASLAHVGGFVFGATVGVAVRVNPSARALVWSRHVADSPSGRWDNRAGGRHR